MATGEGKSSDRTKRELEHGGPALEIIHQKSNDRKAIAYWLGFLQGILASSNIEMLEFAPLRIESENFLTNLDDEDAAELIRDLDTAWDDRPREIYAILQDIVNIRSRDFVMKTEKDEVNEFYGFCAGIVCDSVVTLKEVEILVDRVNHSDILLQNPRVKRLAEVALMAVDDGEITAEESEDISDWIVRLVGDSANDTGISTYGNVGVIDGSLRDAAKIRFDGTMFVLTGQFGFGPRKAIARMIEMKGGFWKNTVCRNTDYLGVAATASRDWKHSHDGLKIIRAFEIREHGDRPDVVEEHVLLKALDADTIDISKLDYRNAGTKPPQFKDMTFFPTGFSDTGKEMLIREANKAGYRKTGDVNGRTKYVVLGASPGAGRLEKARNHNFKVVTHEQFLKMIRT